MRSSTGSILRRGRPTAAVLLLLAAFLASTRHSRAHGTVETNLVASADTTLYETNPTNNLGGSTTLVSGTTNRGFKNRAILRFDLAPALPTNALVLEAQLALRVVTQPQGTPSLSFSLHRLLKPWTEGIQSGNSGAPAAPGEATWTQTGSTPDALWNSPGAGAPADFRSEPSATATQDDAGELAFTGATNLLADLQHWLNHPDENYGWILINHSETLSQSARRFASREDPARAPSLVLGYKTPHADFAIEEVGKTGNLFLIHLDLEPNHDYLIQYTETPNDPQWRVLVEFPAEPFFRHYVWPDEIGAHSARFYRVGKTERAPHPTPAP